LLDQFRAFGYSPPLEKGGRAMQRPLALRILVIANALLLALGFIGCEYNLMKGPIIPTVSPGPPPNYKYIPTISPVMPPPILPPPPLPTGKDDK
jgi:hypothetical protein